MGGIRSCNIAMHSGGQPSNLSLARDACPGSAALDVPGVIDDNAATQALRYMWDTQERRAASEPRLLSCMQSHCSFPVLSTRNDYALIRVRE